MILLVLKLLHDNVKVLLISIIITINMFTIYYFFSNMDLYILYKHTHMFTTWFTT